MTKVVRCKNQRTTFKFRKPKLNTWGQKNQFHEATHELSMTDNMIKTDWDPVLHVVRERPTFLERSN